MRSLANVGSLRDFERYVMGAEHVAGGGVVFRAPNPFPLAGGSRGLPVGELG